MKKICSSSLLLLLALAVVYCTPEYLTEKELRNYVLDEAHGLRQSIQNGDIKIDACFRPSDMLVLQELKNSTSADTSALNTLHKKYSGQYYFILTISRNGKEAVSPGALGVDDFSDVLQNVSFRMSQFVNATTTKQDTIPLKDFLFNRTFGMGAGSEILLVFDRKKTEGSNALQINMSELGLGVGTQHFKFDKTKLDHTPRIDFQKLIK